MSLPWFRKNKALSNCKTEADIVTMSAIRTSLRAELRAVRNGIPGIEKDVDTYQTILDKENILINLFCNKQKSPIDRNVDYSDVVEEFRKFLRNIVGTCSVEQATSNKPATEPVTKPSAEPDTKPTTEPDTKPTTEPAAEPDAESDAKPDTKPATEKSVAEVISELSSESTIADINKVMNKYNTGDIYVQFNGNAFTIRPDAKHDDPILIDRRGKIIIQSKTTKEYYYIPLKVKDNNKNVLNIRALIELLVNGPESVIRQNIEGTAPYYIKEMYDVPTKAIVSVFNFGSLPTNLSNERKSKIIEMIYNAIPDIQEELGGLTAMTNLIEIREDGSILLYATGRNGSINYNLVPKDQAEVADAASAVAAIPEDTNNPDPKPDPKPEDRPASAKKSPPNKKKKKPEQTASTESTGSAEDPSSNPQENAPADNTSADKAAS